jgi:histidine kinase/DNA gyrase B/HSP90-like ATPase
MVESVSSRALAQVVYSIIENATQHAPQESEIAISAQRARDQEVTVIIEDEGPGIPAAFSFVACATRRIGGSCAFRLKTTRVPLWLFGFVFDPDSAAICLDDVTRDRESESQAWANSRLHRQPG